MTSTIPDNTGIFTEGHSVERLEIVAAINQLETTATDSELVASDIRYEQSAKVVEALADGMTQTELADVWHKADGTSYSQQHVSIATRVNELYYYSSKRPTWYAAYNSDEVRKKEHTEHNSGDDEWCTPPEYIAAAREVMGGIDLDPASSASANEVVGATVYFDVQDDGLSRPWAGRVWMNPPYSKGKVWPFCEKLSEHVAAEDISQACVLVNNATETAAFQRMAELASAICFPARRIKFWHPDKDDTDSPLQGQAVLYFGPNTDKFRSVFVDFGFTVTL